MAETAERYLRMDQPACYRVWVQGTISERWREWFDEMEIQPAGEQATCLSGRVPDQAALLGLLQRLYTLGYPLVKIELLE
jgi:hypothetical protein